jgi:hypothetical protein
MAELLIKAIDASNPDPSKDESGCYKKGDIVHVSDDGHEWGSQEGLPTFVVVKCPGVPVATIEDRRNEWVQAIDYAVVSQNAAADGARFRLFVTVPGAANRFGLTLAMVQDWIIGWGGVFVSNTTNEVRFDITVQNAYKSANFWGTNPASVGLVITETGYVQATGIHTATVNTSNSSITPQQVKDAVVAHGGVVVSYANNIGTFTISRSVVQTAFMDDLRSKTMKTVVRRRWGFAASDVDIAIAAGGTITVTAQQLATKAIDKAA